MNPQEEGLRLALEYLTAEPEFIWVYEDGSLPAGTTEGDLDLVHGWMKNYVAYAHALLKEQMNG